jgi:hypothetical protein
MLRLFFVCGLFSCRHQKPQSGNIKPVMTRFGRSSLEVAVAVGTIILGTVLVHFLMSWWPTFSILAAGQNMADHGRREAACLSH